MSIKVTVSSEKTYWWLVSFRDFHKLKTTEEAIDKLIEIHKAWNAGLGAEAVGSTPIKPQFSRRVLDSRKSEAKLTLDEKLEAVRRMDLDKVWEAKQ